MDATVTPSRAAKAGIFAICLLCGWMVSSVALGRPGLALAVGLFLAVLTVARFGWPELSARSRRLMLLASFLTLAPAITDLPWLVLLCVGLALALTGIAAFNVRSLLDLVALPGAGLVAMLRAPVWLVRSVASLPRRIIRSLLVGFAIAGVLVPPVLLGMLPGVEPRLGGLSVGLWLVSWQAALLSQALVVWAITGLAAWVFLALAWAMACPKTTPETHSRMLDPGFRETQIAVGTLVWAGVAWLAHGSDGYYAFRMVLGQMLRGESTWWTTQGVALAGLAAVVVASALLLGLAWANRRPADPVGTIATVLATVLALMIIASPDRVTAWHAALNHRAGDSMDKAALRGLSQDAVPALFSMVQAGAQCRLGPLRDESSDGVPWLNLARWRANRLLQDAQPSDRYRDRTAACVDPYGQREGGLVTRRYPGD